METIYIYYSSDRYNFGDYLGPSIVYKLTKKIPVVNVKRLERDLKKDECCLYSIGSILHMLKNNCNVWGSGSLGNWSNIPVKNNVKIYAVRGPNSQKQLIDVGYSCPQIYCDPGVLAPFLFDITQQPIYDYGIILNIKDLVGLNYEIICNLKKDFHFIEVCDNPYLVVKELSKCRHVISSSLHGLIVSEAMGIPTCYLKTYVRSNDFKVHDFYLGSNRKAGDVKSVWLGKNDQTINMSKVKFTKSGKFNITALIENRPECLELADKNILQKMKQYYGDLMI